MGLTGSAYQLAADAVPLLPEVVLNALQAIEGGHLLRPLGRVVLSSGVVRGVLVLHGICGVRSALGSVFGG